jgi:hypothetical protein
MLRPIADYTEQDKLGVRCVKKDEVVEMRQEFGLRPSGVLARYKYQSPALDHVAADQ